MSKYPERYTGIFRSTLPKDKLIQNISQSHEINFGDAMELLLRIFFVYIYTSFKKIHTSQRRHLVMTNCFIKQ